jgi:hypothetical protein
MHTRRLSLEAATEGELRCPNISSAATHCKVQHWGAYFPYKIESRRRLRLPISLMKNRGTYITHICNKSLHSEAKLYTKSPEQKFSHHSTFASLHNHLTRPGAGTRRRIAGGDRIIDVDLNSGVTGLIRTREANQGTRVPVAATSDLELTAGDVELGAAGGRRAVQGNVLDAEEVFARGEGPGEGDCDLGFTCTRGRQHRDMNTVRMGGEEGISEEKCKRRTRASPAHARRTDLSSLLINLEPNIAAAIPRGRCLALGHLGEVELQRARVRDAALCRETNGVAGLDLVGLGARARRELVAADGVRVDVGDRAIGLVVCRLADVLPGSSLRGTCVSFVIDFEYARGVERGQGETHR